MTMSMADDHDAQIERGDKYCPINTAAYRCGVPRQWLRKAVARGDIPSIMVGKSPMVRLPAVREALRKMESPAKETP